MATLASRERDGLNVDFHILLDLAAIDRMVQTDDGVLFYGFDSALVPLRPPESRRWHLYVTKGIQVTPTGVQKALGDTRVQGELSP